MTDVQSSPDGNPFAIKALFNGQIMETGVVADAHESVFRYRTGKDGGCMFSGTFETETPLLEIGLRMLAAIGIGGAIGLEREFRDRAAGLRTNMLVALSAATFTLLTAELVSEAQEASSVIRMDPMRLMEAVITGVAFLGAGAIIRGNGGAVHGLTTGASLWMSGAVGVAAGGGYYVLAIGAGVLSIFVLFVIGLIEHRFLPGRPDSDGT